MYLESIKRVSRFQDSAFVATILGFCNRMAIALDSIAKSATSASTIPRPPSMKPSTTPKKATSGKPLPPILSPREMRLQCTIDAFLTRISTTANQLKSITNGKAVLVDNERAIRAMDRDENDDAEELFHDYAVQQRAAHQSSASGFVAEAHNREGGNPDSFESGNTSEAHDSDIAFVASQDSQTMAHLHPRFAQAREDINKAAKVLKAPAVISLKEAKDMPAGWCKLGHRINKLVLLKRNKTMDCSFCDAKTLETVFSCYNNDEYCCSDCLANSRTHAPPPKCPSLSCPDGLCTLRFLTIGAVCFNRHPIPAREQFWNCSKCKTRLCEQCATQSAQLASAPSSNTIVNDSLPSTSCSHSPELNPRQAAAMRADFGQ